MTREQMLETALRNANVIVADYKGFTRELLAEIDAALAPPPTSEWNEAIDDAWRACRKLRSLKWQQGAGDEPRDLIIEECENAIRALKRNEQP